MYYGKGCEREHPWAGSSAYGKIGDVYVKIGEADEKEFDWLKDEIDMEIVAFYIDEVENEYECETLYADCRL